MLSAAFVQAQRRRLHERLRKYPHEIRNDSLPPDMRRHKARSLRYTIPAVLKLMDSGEYGICIECGEDIPQRRLLAVPSALMCVKCATEHQGMRQ